MLVIVNCQVNNFFLSSHYNEYLGFLLITLLVQPTNLLQATSFLAFGIFFFAEISELHP